MKSWQAQAYSQAFEIIARTGDVLEGMRSYGMSSAYWTSLNQQLAEIRQTNREVAQISTRVRQIGDQIRKLI
jgi:hypothetical protein